MIKRLGSFYFLSAFVTTYVVLLLAYPSFLSISHFEADIFFNQNSYLSLITRFFCSIFGQDDFGLRIFFILLHFINVVLFYLLSKTILKKQEDINLSVIVFCLLPAANLSALLVGKSGIIIFGTILFVLLYKYKRRFAAFAFLGVLSFTDGAFAVLFLALIFYAISQKDNFLIALSVVLFGVSMGFFGFDDGGKPRGYLLDTVGVYALIFSPLLFFYFVFSLYKTPTNDRSIEWYISFWALIFSLILSLRQRIYLHDFAPFVVIAIPFMVRIFFSSYRVRIRKNKKLYDIGFWAVFLFLSLFFVASFANRPLYMFAKQPHKHFAYNYQIAKELADSLKSMGVTSCDTQDPEMALRLKFYGINHGIEYVLTKKPMPNCKKVSIIYSGAEVAVYYVTKINVL